MASADFSRDSPSQITPPNTTNNTSSTRSDEAAALQRVLSRLAAQRNHRPNNGEYVARRVIFHTRRGF